MTLLTCGNELVSCVNDFLTCANDLLSCGNEIKNERKTVLCPFGLHIKLCSALLARFLGQRDVPCLLDQTAISWSNKYENVNQK